MKTEDQIRALAELDGYKIDGLNVIAPDGCTFSLSSNEVLMAGLPDYRHSYDAIIPLIQKHNRQTQIAMMKIVAKSWEVELGWDATPSQLCEASLRATGRWIE